MLLLLLSLYYEQSQEHPMCVAREVKAFWVSWFALKLCNTSDAHVNGTHFQAKIPRENIFPFWLGMAGMAATVLRGISNGLLSVEYR